jgi:hypothetical protein
MDLTSEQTAHQAEIERILRECSIAYDTSATGSGKTIVATKLAAKLAAEFQLSVTVMGSPILQTTWKRIMEGEGMKYKFVSIFSNSPPVLTSSSFVILDECQVVKNDCNRTLQFARAVRTARFKLMLSATPFDHGRQVRVVEKFIRMVAPVEKDFYSISAGMNFSYPTSLSYALHHVQLDDEEMKQYTKGVQCIISSTSGEGEERFSPEKFSAGLRMIHCALFPGMMRFLGGVLSQGKGDKFIVVFKFAQHFDAFQALYPDASVINGRVSQPRRAEIIRAFQTQQEKTLLAITDVIGGVGIDLDDQEGTSKRHIIALPLFAADFVQLAGRVRRRNSKTNSTITIIQAAGTKRSYFKNQMKKKLPILATFNNSVEFAQNPASTAEHTPECVKGECKCIQ